MPAFPTAFPDQNTPLLSQQGVMTITGMAFLRSLWNRTGGANGVPFTAGETAAGAGHGPQLTFDINTVTGSGDNVTLPDMQPGQQVWVYNRTSNTDLFVWPASGTINGGPSADIVSSAVFSCIASGDIVF